MLSKFSSMSGAFILSAALLFAQIAPIAVLGGLVVTQTACPKSNDLQSYAHEVVGALDEVIPIFRTNNLNTARLEEARSYAARLETALQNSQNGDALSLASSLITAFQAIVAETNSISNASTRTIILVGLAVGNIALHHLADKLAETPSPVIAKIRSARPGEVNQIESFRQRKHWRCRDAATGRFAKMEVCKANPAGTVVETY